MKTLSDLRLTSRWNKKAQRWETFYKGRVLNVKSFEQYVYPSVRGVVLNMDRASRYEALPTFYDSHVKTLLMYVDSRIWMDAWYQHLNSVDPKDRGDPKTLRKAESYANEQLTDFVNDKLSV